MNVRKFAIADASFERSPGQDGDVFAANLVDQRHGGPITVGYGRYAPGQSISESLAVNDVMIVLAGRLSVSTEAGTVVAGPGEIVYIQRARRSRSAHMRKRSSRPTSPIRIGRRRSRHD